MKVLDTILYYLDMDFVSTKLTHYWILYMRYGAKTTLPGRQRYEA